MTLKKLAAETLGALESAIPGDLSGQQKAELAKIVERTLLKAMEEAAVTHHKATVVCCGHEADLAHKIAEEVDRASIALKANLSALR